MVVKVNNNGATIGNVETDIVQETIEVNAMLEDLFYINRFYIIFTIILDLSRIFPRVKIIFIFIMMIMVILMITMTKIKTEKKVIRE